jgi:hypothetical protein
MNNEGDLMRQGMKTPHAAAFPGIAFSLCLMGSMLIRTSIPPDPFAAATEVINNTNRISLALNLLPFAGISFL